MLADGFSTRWSTDPLDAEMFDAAVIAVATEAHVDLAAPLLAAGVAVLVEKPVSIRLADTAKLIAAAECHHTPLQCGFVERFNPAVAAVQRIGGGPALRVDAVRHSPPHTTAHGGVVHDVLLHDLDLASVLVGGTWPTAVLAASAGTIDGSPWPERVDCTIGFDNGAVASLSASRISDRRMRTMTVTYPGLVVELDLIRQEVTTTRDSDGTRRVQHEPGDALSAQLDHFVDLVEGRCDAGAERRSILAAHRMADEVVEAIEPVEVRR